MSSITYKKDLCKILCITLFLIAGCAKDVFIEDNYNDPSSTNFSSDSTFSLITWNLENFAKQGAITVDSLVSLINMINVNIICLQEIKSDYYFQKLIHELDNYDGYRQNSASFNLNLAVIFSEDIEIISINEIYTDDWWSFPRRPQIIHVKWNNYKIIIINNHFKANDNTTNEDENRRKSASEKIDQYITENYDDEYVIILGDLNDDILDPEDENVFWNFISKSDEYIFVDMNIALGNVNNWSFPSWPSHLDHIIISNELFDIYYNSGSKVQTILIEQLMDNDWNYYNQIISDHRPVGLNLNFNLK